MPFSARSLILPLTLALLLSACAARPPASAPPDVGLADIEKIEGIERARFEAMTRQDLAALEPLLADDLVYCHSNGECESREQFLQTIASGRIRYRAIEVRELAVRHYGETAVVNGRIHVEGALGGRDATFDLLFTDVHVREGGAWRLVAWQSTRAP